MKLPISKRLLACAAFVEPGQRVADVGTDHGYLAIYLLQSRLASRVQMCIRDSCWHWRHKAQLHPGGSPPGIRKPAGAICGISNK